MGELSKKTFIARKKEFHLETPRGLIIFRTIKRYKHLAIWTGDEEIGRLSSSKVNWF